jgi:hypothetical protein
MNVVSTPDGDGPYRPGPRVPRKVRSPRAWEVALGRVILLLLLIGILAVALKACHEISGPLSRGIR